MNFKLIVKSLFILLFALNVKKASGQADSTSLLIEELSFDFGEIKQGEIVSHLFSFENTTDTSLLVLHAIPQCGCTTPEVPKEVFAKGETIEIMVKFDSAAKIGYQRKAVRVVLSGNREVKLLIFAQIIE